MSNRRRAKPTAPRVVFVAAAEHHCPDCNSDSTGPRLGTDGVWRLVMHHDDWCPYLREMTR